MGPPIELVAAMLSVVEWPFVEELHRSNPHRAVQPLKRIDNCQASTESLECNTIFF